MDDEDEVLVALAEELGPFVQYVGGPEHAHVLIGPLGACWCQMCLFPAGADGAALFSPFPLCSARERPFAGLSPFWFWPFRPFWRNPSTPPHTPWHLPPCPPPVPQRAPRPSRKRPPPTRDGITAETLAAVEETAVREKTVESLIKIGREMDEASFGEHFVALVQRLGGADWFSARTSAAGLCAVAYERAPAARGAVVALFADLCQDDTPMVRRATATALGPLAKVVSSEELTATLLPRFTALSGDEQDSVRLLALPNCVALCEVLGEELAGEHVHPVVLACIADRSWRVRYMVAQKICPLSELLGAARSEQDFLPAFVNLLNDSEAEVKASAAAQATGFAKLVPVAKVVSELMPCVVALSTDASQHVRCALFPCRMGGGKGGGCEGRCWSASVGAAPPVWWRGRGSGATLGW